MAGIPALVATFLQGRRIAVAGVSREPRQAANAVFRKLQKSGYEVFPLNPNTSEVEGVRCYPDVGAVPARLDGVVIATPPGAAVQIVRQCAQHGIGRIWFHRSFGTGSVSEEAVKECQDRRMSCIVGGCPMMFCDPVDVPHKCMRWWLGRRGRMLS
jgi:uncharacterized protein